MKRGKVWLAHIALDDLAALVHQEGRGCELHVTPSFGHRSGIVNRHLKRQLARLRKIQKSH